MDAYNYKMLTLLDNQVQSCTKCNLYSGGRAKPYWTSHSRYGLFLEAPGKEEVTQNTPVVGGAGKKLWQALHDVGLERSDFLIINSVNCRPVVDGKNGKPTAEEMLSCSDWARKYIRIIKPIKILVMGTYAVQSFNRIVGGDVLPIGSIVENNGKIVFVKFFDVEVHIVVSVHPAYTIYQQEKGMKALKHSIDIFKEIRVESI
jgi:uracil-DNA glycosylase family 4